MKYRITHETDFDYNAPVDVGHGQVILRPRDTPYQRCRVNDIEIQPAPASTVEREDYFGNRALIYAVQEPHHQMTVTSVSVVELLPPPAVSTQPGPAWDQVAAEVRRPGPHPHWRELEYVFGSNLIALSGDLTAYARESFPPGRPIVEAGLELTHRIFTDFRYDPTTTTISTPVSEVFEQRSGVCQDFAHLQIAMLRGLGLPTRYVSGYLRTFRDANDPKLVGADASHAWLALYVGDGQWVDFDPTNDQIPHEHHITIGWGRDYSDVSPVKGVIIGGGEQSIDVRVNVEAL